MFINNLFKKEDKCLMIKINHIFKLETLVSEIVASNKEKINKIMLIKDRGNLQLKTCNRVTEMDTECYQQINRVLS